MKCNHNPRAGTPLPMCYGHPLLSERMQGGLSVRILNNSGQVLHYLMPSNATYLVHTNDGT